MARVLVTLDETAPEEALARTRDVLAEAGLAGEVEATWTKQPGTGNGLILAVVLFLAASSIKDFLQGFAGEAGKDAYLKLKDLRGRLGRARDPEHEGGVHVSLLDERGNEIYISGGLPDEARRDLLELDWDQCQGGGLWWHPEDGWHYEPQAQHWDPDHRKWVP